MEDWIELYNSSISSVDISGWVISVEAACNTTPYTVPNSVSIPAGGYLVIHGSGNPDNNTTTDLYHTDCFFYSPESNIAVSLESTSTGIDFVRTGSSTASPPTGTSWTGTNPTFLGMPVSLGRDAASSDTDDGSDWSSQNPTEGAQNDLSGPLCLANVYGDSYVTLNPTQSAGCPYGVYVIGEVISLTADTPQPGWKVGGWHETDDDYNQTVNNTATVTGPHSWRYVGVNYVQDPPAPGTVLVIENTWSEGFIDVYQYTSALTALNIPYNHWNTRFTDNIPSAAVMSAFDAVIVVRSSSIGNSYPESHFASYLDGGGCLMISNQNYPDSIGITSFMENYLGVASVTKMTPNTAVTGTGSIYSGLGPYTLDFTQGTTTTSDDGNLLTAKPGANAAFTANNGLIAITKETGTYKTNYLGYQFEALPTNASRQAVLRAFHQRCVSSPTQSTMFYSQAPYDGWVLETGENTNKGGLVNTSNLICNIGDDASNKQFRTLLHFNTSRLPDNAVINKVTLQYKQHSIIGSNPYATHGKVWADIKEGFFSNNPGLVKSDFAAAPSMGFAGWFKLYPSGLAYPIYRATLKDTAFQHINLSGITQFRLRFAIDDDNDGTADYLKVFCGNMGVPFNRPVLRVWYYIP
jgi:hypothetical protein